MMGLTKACALLLSLATFANGQPVPVWNQTLAPLGKGNAVTVSPDQSVVYATASSGIIGAMDATSGAVLWTHSHNATSGLTVSSNSGVAFGTGAAGPYVVYAVTEGDDTVDATTYCVVIALADPAGTVLFESEPVEGSCAGTPTVSSDGAYIFLTHNSAFFTVGHFTVLDANSSGTVFYTEADSTFPYTPLGIYQNPEYGYYGGNTTGGPVNTNDINMWTYQPLRTATAAVDGSTFAFQLPVGTDSPAVVKLTTVGWQATAAPVITNSGFSVYFSVSRSGFRSWNGMSGKPAFGFDTGARGTVNFDRGSPGYLAPLNSVALSSDPTMPNVYAGTATTSFAAMTYNLTTLWVANTTSLVQSKAVVSPDDAVVYYSESNGFIVAADAADGTALWTQPLNAGINSDFSLSADGAYLYYGDNFGKIAAWQIGTANATVPTASPGNATTSAPSVINGTITPTSNETIAPTTGNETDVPGNVTTTPTAPGATGEPTAFATEAPFAAPVASEPSLTPVVPPVSAPTSAPTSGASSMAVFSVIAASVAAIFVL